MMGTHLQRLWEPILMAQVGLARWTWLGMFGNG